MLPLFLLLLQLLSTLLVMVSSSSSPSSLHKDYPIAKSGCKDKCGGVDIPYPFGIGANCYLDPSYEIVCNHSHGRTKAILHRYNFEVMDIKGVPILSRSGTAFPDPENQTLTVRMPMPRIVYTRDWKGESIGDLRGSPYRFSRYENILLVHGCSGRASLKDRNQQIMTGCTTVCANNNNNSSSVSNIYAEDCYGVGCCQATLSEYDVESKAGLDFYEIAIDACTTPNSSNTCNLLAAFIKDEKSSFSLSDLNTVTVVLDWHVPHLDGHISHHRECTTYDVQTTKYEDCKCNIMFTGNPYLHNGCKVPVECKHYNSTRYRPQYCPTNSFKQRFIFWFSMGAALMIWHLGLYWVYRLEQWIKVNDQKAKNFRSNGGLLLQQQMTPANGVVRKLTIFTIADLEKATDNFHKDRVLGRGGQGTVYKGMLVDGRIVAVKRSTKIDEAQPDQFINEVVILSQINHRNVVSLLGCCLETEIPLLVYEFVPNGTLYQHIHDPTQDFHLTWKMRLQIAAESAGALAYLHSSSSAPVYHRDIKSSNILLDETYRAKVSDFGISRAITIQETHVTTRILGTYGYLDPEYFQSNQFTEKSDVYSFGVVLVELITGKKPISPTESGENWKILAIEFLSQMENNPHLSDIVDTRVIEEGKEEEFIAAANLAKKCLNMNGKQRPTMKEVSRILDEIRSPYSGQRATILNNECMATEIEDNGPSTSSSDVFNAANRSFSCMSIEVTIEELMLPQ